MNQIDFSILICSIHCRANSLQKLLDEICIQSTERSKIEVLTNIDAKGSKTTGKKRNELLDLAKGKYVAFVDDDDMILPGYVESILNAIQLGPDVVGFKGYITTDGKEKIDWIISKDLNYEAVKDLNGNKVYHRYNNHLSPIKLSIAKEIRFPDKFIGEDYEYATLLKNSGMIKTEVFIDKFLYHYDYRNKTPAVQTVQEPKQKKIYVQPKRGRQNSRRII